MNTTVKSILNGWKNSIEKYNKLDSWKLREQLSTIGKYLRSNDDTKAIVKWYILYETVQFVRIQIWYKFIPRLTKS